MRSAQLAGRVAAIPPVSLRAGPVAAKLGLWGARLMGVNARGGLRVIASVIVMSRSLEIDVGDGLWW